MTPLLLAQVLLAQVLLAQVLLARYLHGASSSRRLSSCLGSVGAILMGGVVFAPPDGFER